MIRFRELLQARANWKSVFDLVGTMAAIVAVIAVVSNGRLRRADARPPTKAAPKVPIEPLSLADARAFGSSAAPVLMMEFSDFQCPFCGRFAREVFPELRASYVDSGRVQWYFRHLPLPMHPDAERAARSAECAGEAGRFWQMHDALFSQPLRLDESGLREHASSAGILTTAFESCLDRQAVRDRIRNDMDLARQLGITGTPAFVLGTRTRDGRLKAAAVIVGAKTKGEFSAALDAILAKGPATQQ